ncbi:MAG: hypothetical protein SGI74_11090 [Oligoflexia bacterium]|nr:hypothetical protein [Oligoflexia bacterium]
MDGFVGKKPPILSRIASSVTFYGIIIGLIIGSFIFFYISESKVTEQELAVQTPVTNPVVANEGTPTREVSPLTASNSNNLKTPLQNARTNSAPKDLQRGAVPSDLTAGSSQKVLDATATNPGAQEANVNIEFALSNADTLGRFQQDAEGNLEIGRHSMAVISQFKTKHDSVIRDGGFKHIAHETRNLILAQPSLVFRGGKEPKSNEAIGFFVEVTPVRTSERGTEYKVSVKRSLPEVTATEVRVVSTNYDETVTLAPQAGIIIAGLLPRKTIIEGEEELYKANVLKALLDPAFQRGDAEFIILIYPQFQNTHTP